MEIVKPLSAHVYDESCGCDACAKFELAQWGRTKRDPKYTVTLNQIVPLAVYELAKLARKDRTDRKIENCARNFEYDLKPELGSDRGHTSLDSSMLKAADILAEDLRKAQLKMDYIVRFAETKMSPAEVKSFRAAISTPEFTQLAEMESVASFIHNDTMRSEIDRIKAVLAEFDKLDAGGNG